MHSEYQPKWLYFFFLKFKYNNPLSSVVHHSCNDLVPPTMYSQKWTLAFLCFNNFPMSCHFRMQQNNKGVEKGYESRSDLTQSRDFNSFGKIILFSQTKVQIYYQQQHLRQHQGLLLALLSMWFIWKGNKQVRRAEEVRLGSGWLLCLVALRSWERVLLRAVTVTALRMSGTTIKSRQIGDLRWEIDGRKVV